MSEHGETSTAGDETAPGTVWRVSLAWPATDADSRQERVDGLQQLLSARSVVGLMGPGRPTRAGLIVDLVLPVDRDRVMLAKRDGVLEPGPEGEEFARILHRYTGAVVVNGDVARGDFAVLASEESMTDESLTLLLDEPLDDVLLVGTQTPAAVTTTAERLGIPGWVADGERPAAAFPEPGTDPTSMVMPGQTGLSVALRERPGRVDLLLWSADPDDTRPSRRRRSARRSALVATHLGARCRPIVLPEYVRPAGSAAASLLLTLDEDFAPLPSAALGRLGRVLPAARVDALAHTVNEAATRGFDPEAGVLAELGDGLLPGEEPDEAPVAPAHHDMALVLKALGEDEALLGLLRGQAANADTVSTVGEPSPSAATAASLSHGEAPHEDTPSGAASEPEAGRPDGEPEQRSEPGVEAEEDAPQGSDTPDAAAGGEPADMTTDNDATTDTDASADTAATGEAAPSGTDDGGFDSLLHRAEHQPPAANFDDLLASGVQRSKPSAPVPAPAAVAPVADDPDAIPEPTPAVGTPASAAGDDAPRARRGAWPMILLVIGIVLVVAAVVLALVAPSLGVAVGTGYVIAGAVGVVGLGVGILGLVRLRR